MSQVIFYIFSEDSNQQCNADKKAVHDEVNESVPAHFMQACIMAAFYYQQNRKVFIYTDNQQDAFMVDETLWQFDGDSFVPHNLLGEGPKFGTPVEISWMPPTHPRPILINLSMQVPDFSINFQQIIDFVPSDEQLKISARLRYSAYKKLGHSLTTETLSSDNNSPENKTQSEATDESPNSNNQIEDK